MTNKPIRHALVLRARAAKSIANVLNGDSLNDALTTDREQYGRHALVEEMVVGTIRFAFSLQTHVKPFLRHPFKSRDHDLFALLLLGLYQAWYMNTPTPVAVSTAVDTAAALNKPWAKGVLNAVLRAALKAPTGDPITSNHPPWLVQAIQSTWPEWPAILTANDQRAPLTLRVDLSRITREHYAQKLTDAGIAHYPHPLVATALIIESPIKVIELPDFGQGLVSVQDAAAQLAAPLLAPSPYARILDACAAPGGKTIHLLEYCPTAILTAIDQDPERIRRLHENCARTHHHPAAIHTTDLLVTPLTNHFDRILLDAPCSATGVIRRHPDIKLHRRPTDITALATRQAALLDRLWQNLTPGGQLLYATCSVLISENEDQIGRFLARTADAAESPFVLTVGQKRPHGWQILPGEGGMDGFYYARLYKTA